MMAITSIEKYLLGKRSSKIILIIFVKKVREVARFEVQDLTNGVLLYTAFVYFRILLQQCLC